MAMTNLIYFLNAFLSYLFVFILIVALVIVACIIGVKWRKSKDAKAAQNVDKSTGSSGSEPA